MVHGDPASEGLPHPVAMRVPHEPLGSEDLFYQRWYRRVFSGFGPGFSQCLVDRLLDHRQEPLPPRRVETLGHPARGTSVTVGGGPGARPGPATVPPAARGARG